MSFWKKSLKKMIIKLNNLGLATGKKF